MVRADQATSGSYTPGIDFSYNSSGGDILITRSGAGVYTVEFAKLGGTQAGANVQVTAYGSGTESCKVQKWDSSGADFAASVRCFTATGNQRDTTYTVMVTRPKTVADRLGYALADQATSGSYIPDTDFSYNSSGGEVLITRSGVGAYSVKLAGLGGGAQSGGNVQVTAHGPGDESCKAESWVSTGPDFTVLVRCIRGGIPIDTNYSLIVNWPQTAVEGLGYVTAGGIYTPPIPGIPAVKILGIIIVPAIPEIPGYYTPTTAFRYNGSGGNVQEIRADFGSYKVTFFGLGSGAMASGNVQVTALGTGNEFCKVLSWTSTGSDFVAKVSCFTATGVPIDTRYTLMVKMPP